MMIPSILKVTIVGLFATWTVSCDKGRSAYPIGTKLYGKADHHYVGQVVGSERSHLFSNGLSTPAVEIEMALEEGKSERAERTWAACNVLSSNYTTEPSR